MIALKLMNTELLFPPNLQFPRAKTAQSLPPRHSGEKCSPQRSSELLRLWAGDHLQEPSLFTERLALATVGLEASGREGSLWGSLWEFAPKASLLLTLAAEAPAPVSKGPKALGILDRGPNLGILAR